jgi:hypothetical protein
MCTCMYIQAYIFKYVCMYPSLHLCICCLYACIFVCNVYICIYICIVQGGGERKKMSTVEADILLMYVCTFARMHVHVSHECIRACLHAHSLFACVHVVRKYDCGWVGMHARMVYTHLYIHIRSAKMWK